MRKSTRLVHCSLFAVPIPVVEGSLCFLVPVGRHRFVDGDREAIACWIELIPTDLFLTESFLAESFEDDLRNSIDRP